MSRHIIIIGGLASGKTTLAKYLADYHGYKRIGTYTTRPIRPGEVEGEDYYFLNRKDFDALVNTNFFFETTNYTTIDGVWSYGSSRYPNSLHNKTVVVLNPHGALLFKDPALIVWLDLPLKVTMERALVRGDDPLEVARRVIADAHDFDLEEIVNVSNVRVRKIMELSRLAEYVNYASNTYPWNNKEIR